MVNVAVGGGGGSGGNVTVTGPLGTTTAAASVATTVNGNITLANSTNTIGNVTQGTSPWVVNMTQVGGANITLGQKTAAASLPVTLASDQGNVPVNNAQVNGVTVLTGTGATGTGAQRVTVAVDSATFAGSTPVNGGADGVTASSMLETMNALLNAAGTADRARANLDLTLLASGSISANSADQTNWNGRGVVVFVNVSAVSGGETVTVAVQMKDPVSGLYSTVLTSTALAAVALTLLRVYPGLGQVANLSANDILSRTWRITATIAGGGAITFSVGASVIW